MAEEIIKVDSLSERAFDASGKEWTDEIYVYCRRRAHQKNKYLKHQIRKTDGKSQFRMVDVEPSEEFDISSMLGDPYSSTASKYTTTSSTAPKKEEPVEEKVRVVKNKTTKELLNEIVPIDFSLDDEQEIVDFIASSPKIKPDFLKMSDSKWKMLVRSVVRGKNIMMTGPSGEGKTVSVHALVATLGRPFFYLNMGNTQDAQTALIGKTHFEQSKGTFFEESYFVKAIKTENAIILLDELSRANDDASNILMTVLDENQRYLRLTEDVDSETIPVAKGVTFVATANIGNEYTATQVMDRALLDRFVRIEVDSLDKKQKTDLIKSLYPGVPVKFIENISDLSEKIAADLNGDAPQVNTLLSTRACIDTVGLIADGFTFTEAVEHAVYPFFDKDGGTNSPRTFVTQIVQKYGNDRAASTSKPF